MLHEAVIAAARLIVAPSGRTLRARITRKVEPLTLVAPTPVVLAAGAPGVEDQFVVSAPSLIVGAAGRALRARIAPEEEPLALVAPSPVVLANGVVTDDAGELRSI